jgi:hypothetical protein
MLNLRDLDTTASTSADQHPSSDENAAARYWEAASATGDAWRICDRRLMAAVTSRSDLER